MYTYEQTCGDLVLLTIVQELLYTPIAQIMLCPLLICWAQDAFINQTRNSLIRILQENHLTGVITKREREGQGRERVLTILCLTCSEAGEQMRGREECREGIWLCSLIRLLQEIA